MNNSYDNVFDMFNDKVDAIEEIFKENLELTSKLQINTIKLVSCITELKGSIFNINTEIQNTRTAIDKGDVDSLNEGIKRLNRILSFTYRERKPNRVAINKEANDADDTSNINVVESSFSDSGAIDDITIDFESIFSDVSSSNLEDSLRNSFETKNTADLPPLDDADADESADVLRDDGDTDTENEQKTTVESNAEDEQEYTNSNAEDEQETTEFESEAEQEINSETTIESESEAEQETTETNAEDEQETVESNAEDNQETVESNVNDNEQETATKQAPRNNESTIVSTKTVSANSVLAMLKNARIK